MARTRIWRFNPGETRDLGVSMVDELDSANTGASMTGETPVVSAWTGNDDDGYTQANGFTFANEQVNTSARTDVDGNTIPVGEGILFRCTAPTTLGTYVIRSESDADNGAHPSRHDIIIVEGPGAPA